MTYVYQTMPSLIYARMPLFISCFSSILLDNNKLLLF